MTVDSESDPKTELKVQFTTQKIGDTEISIINPCTEPKYGGMTMEMISKSVAETKPWVGGPTKNKHTQPMSTRCYRDFKTKQKFEDSSWVEGTKVKLSLTTSNWHSWIKDLSESLEEIGLDTVFYQQDSDKEFLILEQPLQTSVEETRKRCSEYSSECSYLKESLSLSAKFLRNSMDEGLWNLISHLVEKKDGGPVIFMLLNQYVKGGSVVIDELLNTFKTMKLVDYEGLNVSSYHADLVPVVNKLNDKSYLPPDAANIIIQNHGGASNDAFNNQLSVWSREYHLSTDILKRNSTISNHLSSLQSIYVSTQKTGAWEESKKTAPKANLAFSTNKDKGKKKQKNRKSNGEQSGNSNLDSDKEKEASNKDKNQKFSYYKNEFDLELISRNGQKLYWCKKCNKGRGQWVKHSESEHETNFVQKSKTVHFVDEKDKAGSETNKNMAGLAIEESILTIDNSAFQLGI